MGRNWTHLKCLLLARLRWLRCPPRPQAASGFVCKYCRYVNMYFGCNLACHLIKTKQESVAVSERFIHLFSSRSFRPLFLIIVTILDTRFFRCVFWTDFRTVMSSVMSSHRLVNWLRAPRSLSAIWPIGKQRRDDITQLSEDSPAPQHPPHLLVEGHLMLQVHLHNSVVVIDTVAVEMVHLSWRRQRMVTMVTRWEVLLYSVLLCSCITVLALLHVPHPVASSSCC